MKVTMAAGRGDWREGPAALLRTSVAPVRLRPPAGASAAHQWAPAGTQADWQPRHPHHWSHPALPPPTTTQQLGPVVERPSTSTQEAEIVLPINCIVPWPCPALPSTAPHSWERALGCLVLAAAVPAVPILGETRDTAEGQSRSSARSGSGSGAGAGARLNHLVGVNGSAHHHRHTMPPYLIMCPERPRLPPPPLSLSTRSVGL